MQEPGAYCYMNTEWKCVQAVVHTIQRRGRNEKKKSEIKKLKDAAKAEVGE